MQEEIVKDPTDSSPVRTLAILRDTTRKVLRITDLMGEGEDFVMISAWGKEYKTAREYDSVQHTLPADDRDNWLKRMWNRKAFSLKEKYGKDPERAIKTFADALLHKLPYLLFVSLPLFALLLKLLYIRSKKVLYAGHTIFSIHQYIFSFILIFFIMIFDLLQKSTGFGAFGIISALLMIVWPVHLYISMKKFYGQGWLKTILKMILLNLFGLVIIVVLFIVFILFSVFQL